MALTLCSVVPKLKSMVIPHSGCQAIVEELREQWNRFAFPDGYRSPTLDSITQHFSKQFAERVPLVDHPEVVRAFDWCISVQQPGLCATLVARLTQAHYLQERDLIQEVLLPLLPDLRKWGARHNMLDTLAPVFAKTMAAWVDYVLGPRPQTSTAATAQLDSLGHWTCPCEPCMHARGFLAKGTQRTVVLQRIGAPAKKHVEAYLAVRAAALANWETVRTSPQGLEVSATSSC